jgi:hypothetical protein
MKAPLGKEKGVGLRTQPMSNHYGGVSFINGLWNCYDYLLCRHLLEKRKKKELGKPFS